MHQTIPRTICFHSIVRDWHFWAYIAKLTFGKLAVNTSPDMSSPFTLKELSATDCGVMQNMFLDLTAITSENILGFSRGSPDNARIWRECRLFLHGTGLLE